MIEREWKEEYNIGCEYVDSAHRKLFKILWKVIDLLSEREYEKHKHACIEAIKFLYNYTATHFAEEEAYMKEIGYEGFEVHKRVHDEIKNVTVPMHDRILQENDYSKEAVREFVGFFIGWLTGHILVMDRSITDNTVENINISNTSVEEKIIKEIADFFMKFSGYSLAVVSQTYDGNVYEESIYYELSYKGADILFMAEKETIKKITSEMMGKRIEVIDKAVLVSFIQLMINAGRVINYSVSAEIANKPSNHQIISSNDIKEHIEKKTICNYVEWKIENDKIAVWVLK